MDHYLKTYPLEEEKILNALIVKADSFEQLRFARPEYDPSSFDQISSLYQNYIIKKYSPVFGKIVLFSPDDDILNRMDQDPHIFDPLSSISGQFRENILIRSREICFRNRETEDLYQSMERKGRLSVAEGKRNKVSFVPVGRQMGYLSRSFSDASLAVNTSFFVMDQWDCATMFDYAGIPLGLMIENGEVLNPAQYDREAFLIRKDGSISVEPFSLKQLKVEIDETIFEHGKNCIFCERLHERITPRGGIDLIIRNGQLIACLPDGLNPVPSGGFVIHTDEKISFTSKQKVTYHAPEDIIFAIQVGNSVMRNGQSTDRFLSPFYRFYDPFSVSYPPSMYTLNFRKTRAPRILFGSDRDGKPMFIWIEGAGKFGHVAGEESEGASMSEAVMVAKDAGMFNGIHLDGGGSAQILMNGKRSLHLSDRDAQTGKEIERAVPMALIIR